MKVTIEVDITDEDLEAGLFHIWRGPPPKNMEDPLSEEDMMEWVIKPAIQFRLHLDRSLMRWHKLKIYDHLPKSEEGHTFNELTDKDGNTHNVMLPNGNMWKPQVTRPAEGSWDCKNSPTKVCWYDDHKDPCWDFCLFCGNPHERK